MRRLAFRLARLAWALHLERLGNYLEDVAFVHRWPVVRVFRDPVGIHIFVGPWAARFSWSRQGYFANGSHYFSGWHRWAEDAELSCASTKP